MNNVKFTLRNFIICTFHQIASRLSKCEDKSGKSEEEKQERCI